MRFSIAAAVAALGAVASATIETAVITDLSIRDNNGIQSTSFTVMGLKCSATDPSQLANNSVVTCGDSEYRFAIEGSNSDYTLTVYRQTGNNAGIYGTTKPAVYCRAGGDGVNDFICSQTGQVTVTLK